MLNGLDKKKNITELKVDSNEGERILLSSNKGDIRSPSLDLIVIEKASEDQSIKYLVDILVEGFLLQQKYASNTKQQKSSNLL